MRCEIVAVGTELLLGQIVDTNSAWLARRLAELGVGCYRQTRVGDNVVRLCQVLAEAASRAEAVVVCGGLGPTDDDVTREGLARALGVELIRDEPMADAIAEIFASRGRTMPATNLRQADLPQGCELIPQVIGTAPGIVARFPAGPGRPTTLYCIPGVPAEMEEMFDRAVAPQLAGPLGGGPVIGSRVLNTWGRGESSVAELVAERVEAQTNPTIAFLAGAEGVRLRLTAAASSAAEAAVLLDAEEAELRKLLGDVVYGTETSLAEAVAELALARGARLGVAESLTGGTVGAMLTEVPGASRWFAGSVVSYASQVKFRLLGVPEGPVVSAEAAATMAEGARTALGASVGLAVTGVAGPEPQEGLEVGTVFVAVSAPGLTPTGTVVRQLRLHGDRRQIRRHSALDLLDLTRRVLAGLPVES